MGILRLEPKQYAEFIVALPISFHLYRVSDNACRTCDEVGIATNLPDPGIQGGVSPICFFGSK